MQCNLHHRTEFTWCKQSLTDLHNCTFCDYKPYIGALEVIFPLFISFFYNLFAFNFFLVPNFYVESHQSRNNHVQLESISKDLLVLVQWAFFRAFVFDLCLRYFSPLKLSPELHSQSEKITKSRKFLKTYKHKIY